MGQNDNCAELIELARSLDLYARRHRIIFALDVGEFEKALHLCRSAITDCETGIQYVFSSWERDAHRRNLSQLRRFEQQILAASHSQSAAFTPNSNYVM